MPAEFPPSPEAMALLQTQAFPTDKPRVVYVSAPHPSDANDGIIIKIDFNTPPLMLEEKIKGFNLPPQAARVIANRGFHEIRRVNIRARRTFNQGQGGDAVGSTYDYGFGITTTNRNGSTEQDSSSAVVKKDIDVPMIIMINDEGKLIKLLVASRMVLDENNQPICDFFNPENILNSEQLEIYNRYHGTREKIDMRTRMILAQAEGTLAEFHKAIQKNHIK